MTLVMSVAGIGGRHAVALMFLSCMSVYVFTNSTNETCASAGGVTLQMMMYDATGIPVDA